MKFDVFLRGQMRSLASNRARTIAQLVPYGLLWLVKLSVSFPLLPMTVMDSPERFWSITGAIRPEFSFAVHADRCTHTGLKKWLGMWQKTSTLSRCGPIFPNRFENREALPSSRPDRRLQAGAAQRTL